MTMPLRDDVIPTPLPRHCASAPTTPRHYDVAILDPVFTWPWIPLKELRVLHTAR